MAWCHGLLEETKAPVFGNKESITVQLLAVSVVMATSNLLISEPKRWYQNDTCGAESLAKEMYGVMSVDESAAVAKK